MKIAYLYENHKNQPVFLNRPKTNYEYNFGGMNKEELLTEFRNKIKIELSELKELSKLWKLYQQDDCDEMIRIAEKLKEGAKTYAEQFEDVTILFADINGFTKRR